MKKNKNSNKIIWIILAAITAVILMGVVGAISTYNKAIGYDEQIQTAYSDINVQEKRRADLIPNLVECVEQYDKHEYNTLMAIVKERGTNSDATVEEVQTMIAAVAEAYPELKSNENYRNLMNELATTENLIANYRKNYNHTVNQYKVYIRRFPHSQILSLMGYEVRVYERLDFDVSDTAPSNLFGE